MMLMWKCDPSSGSRARLRFALLALGGLATACGDDLRGPDPGGDCADTAASEFPEGSYGRPEDLVLDGSDCAPGSLADVDLDGRWSVTGEGQFSFELPLVRESCEGGIDMDFESYDERLVHRDDTSLFWRSWIDGDDFHIVSATRACAIPGSEELAIATVRCFRLEDEDENCAVEQGRMKRFARPEGEGEADRLELVSEWEGDGSWPDTLSLNVKVSGGVAFLARFGELRLIDVSNPDEPADLGRVASEDNPGEDFNDVKLFEADGGTHALLAGTLTTVVDARDPERPAVVAKVGEYSHSVFVRTDEEGRPLAYLANYGAEVPIYDLSTASDPVLVERVPLPEGVGVHDLHAEEDRIYVSGTGSGFLVMQREGATWSVAGQLATPYSHTSWVGDVAGRRVAVHGDEGRDAHLRVVDVDPGSSEFMSEIGSYQTRPEVSIHNMMLLGSRVYLTYYQDGVRILDLADPARPELAAYFHTWDVETGGPGSFDGAIGLDVDLEAGLIYVADLSRGLLILRESE